MGARERLTSDAGIDFLPQRSIHYVSSRVALGASKRWTGARRPFATLQGE